VVDDIFIDFLPRGVLKESVMELMPEAGAIS
jgi:hypothetical protein